MLKAKLDRLAAAFAARGIPVSSNLRPGASNAALDGLAEELGVVLPSQLRELYSWRNGHSDPEASSVLVFRDNTFIGLDEIPRVRQLVLDTYGSLEDDADVVPIGVSLRDCIPIADFMGSTYVVACGPQSVTTRSPHPVLNTFQGISLSFYSIESMVDTCIDWVEQPDYQQYKETPNEMEIWERHNPGIFSSQ